jgi:hypothetical protein
LPQFVLGLNQFLCNLLASYMKFSWVFFQDLCAKIINYGVFMAYSPIKENLRVINYICKKT